MIVLQVVESLECILSSVSDYSTDEVLQMGEGNPTCFIGLIEVSEEQISFVLPGCSGITKQGFGISFPL